MLPKSISFDESPKGVVDNRLRKTHSEDGLNDDRISPSIQTIADVKVKSEKIGNVSKCSEPKGGDGIKRQFLEFLKTKLRIIPVMRTSTNKEKEATNSENPVENRENDAKMMESEASVYEIDELNSTIAPSSSRQCIVGADLECAPAVKIKKPKRKPMQRTEFHPQPPFSCVPIYTAILLGLLIVLIVGAVTTIVNMRPAFIYGKGDNSTVISFQEIEFSTLKPQ